jgi:hypothetical protein
LLTVERIALIGAVEPNVCDAVGDGDGDSVAHGFILSRLKGNGNTEGVADCPLCI